MTLYFTDKSLPWTLPLSIEEVAKKGRWDATRIWLLSYIFEGKITNDLCSAFDALSCRVHLRPTQMDPVVHLLPLGVKTSSSMQDTSCRIFHSTYCPLQWALFFADAAMFRFLLSRGAPLEKYVFDAFVSSNQNIALRTARQYRFEERLKLPPHIFLSADVIRALVVNGVNPILSAFEKHCANAEVFRWCEASMPLLWSEFSENGVQLLLFTYIAHHIYDIPLYLLLKDRFQTVFPINRTLRSLLQKTSPEAVSLMKTIYRRRAAPITFDDGMSALQYAAQIGNQVMVVALLESGDHAYRDYTNGFPGFTTFSYFGFKNAATYARDAKHESLAKVIEEWKVVEELLDELIAEN